MHLPSYGAGAIRSEGKDPRRPQKNATKFKSRESRLNLYVGKATWVTNSEKRLQTWGC